MKGEDGVAVRSHNHKVPSFRQGSFKNVNRRRMAPNSVDKALGLAYTEDNTRDVRPVHEPGHRAAVVHCMMHL